MGFRKQVVFPRETLVVSWKGLWCPSPLVTESPPSAVSRGLPSSLWRRGGPEVDTGLELEHSSSPPDTCWLLGHDCLKRKPLALLGFLGKGELDQG